MDEIETVFVWRYETDHMAQLRTILLAHHTDDEIDTFKDCLCILERQGFKLRGPVQ